jgi:hypothetical protein
LHEIGHALGVILCSKERAHVYLGAKNLPENLRIGRIHFHIRWGLFGFCTPQKGSSLTRKQSLGFIAGGPIMTLAVLLFASYLARYFAAPFLFEYFSISCNSSPANLSKMVSPMQVYPQMAIRC